MSAIKILAETNDTITISRKDWQKLQEELEEAEDRGAIAERRAYERLVGKDTARRDYLAGAEALRLLSGESPVKVWREKRGLSQRALAAQAGVASSYVAEIETSRKPGSDDAYRKLAAVLQVPPEELNGRYFNVRDPGFGPVFLCLPPHSMSTGPGQPGGGLERRRYSTAGEALSAARAEWASLRARGPWITDSNHVPIYTHNELVREIEG